MTDQNYMLGLFNWRNRRRGWTNPNPMVGAVIVKTVGSSEEGYHKNAESFMQGN